MEIVTKRLRLRQLQTGDASWLAREIANPLVQTWLTTPPHPYGVVDAESFIANNSAAPLHRVIESAGSPLGVVSIGEARNDVPDLGYWLAEHAWGHGYMTEAARALLNHAFAAGSKQISSGWITGNDASRKVLSKLGFEADGRTETRSEFLDKTVTVEKVRMTAERWQTLRDAR